MFHIFSQKKKWMEGRQKKKNYCIVFYVLIVIIVRFVSSACVTDFVNKTDFVNEICH